MKYSLSSRAKVVFRLLGFMIILCLFLWGMLVVNRKAIYRYLLLQEYTVNTNDSTKGYGKLGGITLFYPDGSKIYPSRHINHMSVEAWMKIASLADIHDATQINQEIKEMPLPEPGRREVKLYLTAEGSVAEGFIGQNKYQDCYVYNPKTKNRTRYTTFWRRDGSEVHWHGDLSQVIAIKPGVKTSKK